jgi:hypothetical protein
MSITNPARGLSAWSGVQRTAALAGGDALVFLLFAAIGRSSHGAAAGLDALLQVAGTAAPFAAGWLVAAPLVGAYRPAVIAALRPMLARTALAWLAAWPVGLGLRALLLQRGIPISFALVTLATVLLLLLAWRSLFVLAASRAAK